MKYGFLGKCVGGGTKNTLKNRSATQNDPDTKTLMQKV